MAEKAENAAPEAVTTDVAPAIEPDIATETSETQEIDPLDRVARAMGHAPKDQWRGDPNKWVDAETFIKNTAEINKSLKDQVARTAKMAEQAVKQAHDRAAKEAEERIRAASEIGDTDAALKAAHDLSDARRTVIDPVAQFTAENPWFETDDDATNIAKGAAQRAAERGIDGPGQLEAAKAAVKRMMPHLFGEAPLTNGKGPPALQGGQRVATITPRKKGFSDLPPDAKKAALEFEKKHMLTREEAAEAYWKENA